jgi:hypothetical protein
MRYDAEWPENGHFGPMSVANARIWAILGVTDARKWPKFAVFGIGPLIGIHTGPGTCFFYRGWEGRTAKVWARSASRMQACVKGN